MAREDERREGSGVSGPGTPGEELGRAGEHDVSLPTARSGETSGTLAGEDVRGGAVLSRGRRETAGVQQWDNTGRTVTVDPALAGTVAGDTSSAGAALHRVEDEEPEDAAEDLGPEGTIVQEIGGEARH